MDNKWNLKRIIALVGVVLIGVMFIATLITAIVESLNKYFRGFLVVTIALPIAIWIFLWSYGAMVKKHTMASFDFGGEKSEEDTDSDN